MRLIVITALLALITTSSIAVDSEPYKTDYATNPSASEDQAAVDAYNIDQMMAELENGTLLLDLAIGRQAGNAEILGQIAETSYYGNGTDKMDDATFDEIITPYREAVIKYNKLLKVICNESRYNELKIRCPGAIPAGPDDLVNEYGDYIGSGASYDGDDLFYDDTRVMYVVVGRQAGNAEILGQIAETSYYGNGTEKLDYGTFTMLINQLNIAISDYNTLMKKHSNESTYNEYKMEELESLKIQRSNVKTVSGKTFSGKAVLPQN